MPLSLRLRPWLRWLVPAALLALALWPALAGGAGAAGSAAAAVDAAAGALGGGPGGAVEPWPWWALALALFALTGVLGVLAVLAGIGGGVLFVPIVSGLMPFVHIDFVRGAGIMVALTGALAAGPRLIQAGLADLRLSIPVALAASAGSYFGAVVGLQLPVAAVQLTLGLVILATVALMAFVRPREQAGAGRPDRLASWLGIGGTYREAGSDATLAWRPQSMVTGIVLFAGIGFMAGLFGLGAGWANVPVLNLVMALPLRLSVGTSYFVLAIAGPSAALVYLASGAMQPLVVVPSVLGIMLGARLGTWLLVRTRTAVLRRIVIGVLLVAGLRALLRGLGI
jgi:hypothetical protein